MNLQRPLVLFPYVGPGAACWVFDDPRTGLKEEAFVEGSSEIITRVVARKGIPDAARGVQLIFSDQLFEGHDVVRRWTHEDPGGGNWYEGDVFGEWMVNWLCPALLLYFAEPPQRLYVRCEPLPAGIDPIWIPGPGEERRRFVEPR
jgi:hypothetical protein